MTGYGKRGKPKAGFPSFPTALGNRKRRDSHIPTAPARRGKVENQTQVSHFPTCCLFFSERRPGARFAPLQAHRSIRKCCPGVVAHARTPNTDAWIEAVRWRLEPVCYLSLQSSCPHLHMMSDVFAEPSQYVLQ